MQVIQRAKNSEKEVKQVKKQLDNLRNEQTIERKMLIELQQKEIDFQEHLNVKDNQLAVLRVRLQESDEKSKGQSNIIDGLTTENKRLIEGASVSSGIHSQALHTLEEKYNEIKLVLDRERNEHVRNSDQLNRRISELET